MLKAHPEIDRINSALAPNTGPLAKDIRRYWDKQGKAIPEESLIALFRDGTPDSRLHDRVALDYHTLFWSVMEPHLDRVYKAAAAGQRAPGEQARFENMANRWLPYMINEQIIALRTLGRMTRLTTAGTDFGYDLVRNAYGLNAQDAVRAANWALTANPLIKADPEAIDRLLARYAGEPRPLIDPTELEREERLRRLSHVRAVSRLKEERAALIAEEESTRAFHEGRYAVEEALAEERSALAGREIAPERPTEPAWRAEEREAERRAAEPYVVGQVRYERWITHPEASRTGVCPRCIPLEGIERQVGHDWPHPTAAINMPLQEGVHPLCKCTTEFYSVVDWSDGSITTLEG